MEIKVDEMEQNKASIKDAETQRKCKPRCCLLWLVALLAVYLTCVLIRLATADKGSECESVDDAPTVEEWNKQGLPQVEFASCMNLSIPLSMVRVHGTHNSYKKKPVARAMALGLNTQVKSIDYEHPFLESQLDDGMRLVELDIHYGFDNAQIKVLHGTVLDDQTTCNCLVQCLSVVKKWSDAHPNHVPINIHFDIKGGAIFDSFRATFSPPKEEDLLMIDAAIRKVWKNDRASVFTPDDFLRGSGTDSLAEAVETRGWPTLQSMRGKVYFGVFASGTWDLEEYTEKGAKASLQTRQMFVFQELTPDGEYIPAKHVALLKVDDVSKYPDKVLQLVRRGYMVRSRANLVHQDFAEFEQMALATFHAGVQLVSMDSEINSTWSNLFNASENVAICANDYSPTWCDFQCPLQL